MPSQTCATSPSQTMSPAGHGPGGAVVTSVAVGSVVVVDVVGTLEVVGSSLVVLLVSPVEALVSGAVALVGLATVVT
jgi:hypothetical protein